MEAEIAPMRTLKYNFYLWHAVQRHQAVLPAPLDNILQLVIDPPQLAPVVNLYFTRIRRGSIFGLSVGGPSG